MPFRKFAQPLLKLPRYAKRAVALVVDICICVLTVWLAFYLRTDSFYPLMGAPFWAWVGALVIALPLFVVFGFYRAIFRYSGLAALKTVAMAIGVYTLAYASLFTAFGVQGIPRTIGLIQPLLLLFGIGATRVFARYWLGGVYQHQVKINSLPKVLIYGAGEAGRQLASALVNSHEMRVKGFLDDDDRLHGQVLNGLTIYPPGDLQSLVRSLSINHVLLAMPSVKRVRRNEILKQVAQAKVAIRTLPGVLELAQGKVSVTHLHELDIDDLLGREPVKPNQQLLRKNIVDKVVLVTGAGGSIGSELCRQIIQLQPQQLLLVEVSEHALYAIHAEIEKFCAEVNVLPLLASVGDRARMSEIISTWRPHTIYHAAAYKHVPLVEENVVAGINNNVLGTMVTAQLAQENGVSDFVLISTDKAVRPTNIMGASKRLSELVLQALAEKSDGKTVFSMVRFGNVLDSSGSVVPRFRQQIRDGGPITLTHPEITRFFMTIPEAAQLVIQAGALATGGEVFVLDMGKPIKILDLATRMIELSGLTVQDENNPEGDINITTTGLRPGEKLYEELLIGDNPTPTTHPRIMMAHEEHLAWDSLQQAINALQMALENNDILIIKKQLAGLVSGYTSEREIVDRLFLAKERS